MGVYTDIEKNLCSRATFEIIWTACDKAESDPPTQLWASAQRFADDNKWNGFYQAAGVAGLITACATGVFTGGLAIAGAFGLYFLGKVAGYAGKEAYAAWYKSDFTNFMNEYDGLPITAKVLDMKIADIPSAGTYLQSAQIKNMYEALSSVIDQKKLLSDGLNAQYKPDTFTCETALKLAHAAVSTKRFNALRKLTTGFGAFGDFMMSSVCEVQALMGDSKIGIKQALRAIKKTIPEERKESNPPVTQYPFGFGDSHQACGEGPCYQCTTDPGKWTFKDINLVRYGYIPVKPVFTMTFPDIDKWSNNSPYQRLLSDAYQKVLGNVLYRDEASHKANRVIWKIEGEGDNLFLINLGSSNTIDSSKMYKSIIMGLGIDGGTTTSSQFHLQDVVFDLNPATLGINLGVAVVRPIQEYISNKANWKVIQEEQKCTNALNGLDDQQRRVSALKEVMTTGAYFDNIVKSLSDLVEAAKNYKTAMAAVTKDGYLPNCKVAYELAFNMFKLVLRWQSLMVMFHALLELHQQALGAFLMMREMENARAGVEGKIMQELLDHHKKGKCASNCYVYKT